MDDSKLNRIAQYANNSTYKYYIYVNSTSWARTSQTIWVFWLFYYFHSKHKIEQIHDIRGKKTIELTNCFFLSVESRVISSLSAFISSSLYWKSLTVNLWTSWRGHKNQFHLTRKWFLCVETPAYILHIFKCLKISCENIMQDTSTYVRKSLRYVTRI